MTNVYSCHDFVSTIYSRIHFVSYCHPAKIPQWSWRISGKPHQAGEPREVPLSKRAQELFSKVKVFTVESHTLDTNFRLAKKRAGLSGFTFHDSRHTACTRLAKILDPMTLAKVLGHKDLKHTLIYYNPTTDEIADRLG